jgi:hypothetical protein
MTLTHSRETRYIPECETVGYKHYGDPSGEGSIYPERNDQKDHSRNRGRNDHFEDLKSKIPKCIACIVDFLDDRAGSAAQVLDHIHLQHRSVALLHEADVTAVHDPPAEIFMNGLHHAEENRNPHPYTEEMQEVRRQLPAFERSDTIDHALSEQWICYPYGNERQREHDVCPHEVW